MSRATLPAGLKLVFGDEGGYSNVKTDRGGPTKYGITHRTLAASRGVASVTPQQVKDMTIEEAATIYERSYWTQCGGDLLPPGLDYFVFNNGIMSGPAVAVKTLQRVVGVRPDGVVGAQTVHAVSVYVGGVAAVIRAYSEAYMSYLRTLKNAKTGFPVNGRGWTIRITGKDPKGQWPDKPGVVGNALSLALGAADGEVSVSVVAAGMAKADALDTGLLEVIKKPEAWGPATGLLSASAALTAGNGPVQWALALGMVALVGVGLVFFVQRVRST